MSDEKKLSDRLRSYLYSMHPIMLSVGELFRYADEIADLEQRLESMQKHNLRDGKWLDDLGCCRVCNGEIPYGHTSDCDYYKLEKRLAEAERLHSELLFCVAQKIPGETCHETALRYIKERESREVPGSPQENTHD